MRIALCEDDETIRNYESLLIEQWSKKSQRNVTVDCYSSAENFLFESEDRMEYDLMLLDIQMGKINGFELAKTLRGRGFSGSLAFVTGVMDYVLEGYEVGAIRYILKPVNEDNFFQILEMAYADCKKEKDQVFLLQIGNDVSKIPFSQIIYVEADGHYVHLKGIKDFEKSWKAAFGNVSKDFDGHGFFCLRRGLMVNLLHVSKITKSECFLTNGEVLPVSRNNYDELNRAFINFYREKI